jgi:hypothetical protein
MLKFAFCFSFLVWALPAAAQHQTLICADCRDVQAHPADYGNYAFNRLIEPLEDDFSIFTTYATSTYVYNLEQQWALVLLEDVIENTGASASFFGITVPIQISSDYVRITVQDQHGASFSYEVIETSKPLVVGDGSTPPPPTHPAPAAPPASNVQSNLHPPQRRSSPHAGRIQTPCCQSGEFYWYYSMPEFQILTFKE